MPPMNRTVARWGVLLMAGASLAACASVGPPAPRYPSRMADLSKLPPPAKGPQSYKTGEPYQVGGIWYVPHEQPDYNEVGVASWYGDAFNQKATANGEIFDMDGFSAAHTTLPLPSLVEVTNLENGKKLTVRVNDRGPFVGGRIIDLSHAAAIELGYADKGLAKVRVRYVGPAPLAGPDAGVRIADASQPASGFMHKPMATRLPPSSAPAPSAPIQYASASQAQYAASYSPSRAGAASAAAPQVDDDVILTSYKAPQPVGVSDLAAMPVKAAASAAPAIVAAAPSAPPMPPAARSGRPHAPLTGADLGPPRTMTIQTARADVPRGERIALPEFSTPAASAASAATTGYRIQAGAFSTQDNAQKAAAQLASAGGAVVEPFERNGTTYYRVFVPGAPDEVEAYAIRDKVAAAGFVDARVVPTRPIS